MEKHSWHSIGWSHYHKDLCNEFHRKILLLLAIDQHRKLLCQFVRSWWNFKKNFGSVHIKWDPTKISLRPDLRMCFGQLAEHLPVLENRPERTRRIITEGRMSTRLVTVTRISTIVKILKFDPKYLVKKSNKLYIIAWIFNFLHNFVPFPQFFPHFH